MPNIDIDTYMYIEVSSGHHCQSPPPAATACSAPPVIPKHHIKLHCTALHCYWYFNVTKMQIYTMPNSHKKLYVRYIVQDTLEMAVFESIFICC